VGHRNRLLVSWVICVSIAAAAVDGPGKTGETALTTTADQVVRAREAAMQEKSTAQDVERYLAFLTDDVVYEDPVVKAHIEGKSNVRKGMSNYLGAYKQTVLTIKHTMTAGNAVVLEISVSFTDAETGRVIMRDQVTVLEFQDTKVRRILDYWTRS